MANSLKKQTQGEAMNIPPGIDRIQLSDGTARYRVRIRIKGHKPISKNFKTLTHAKQWKRVTEGQIEKGLYVSFSKADQHTVAEAIRRYRKEILPLKTKDGHNVARHLNRWEKELGHETDGHWSLRILGETPQAEIGASVALEIDHKLYFPIHDLQGSITALIDPETQTIADECSYSAFGVGSSHSEITPWGYLSKSKDQETGLIFFGRRFYDPNLGRWMTADPKGYTDSMNLYAFALNNPFLLVDPYGLENELMQKVSDVGAFTVNNTSQGFFHPINTLSEFSSDLRSLGNATYNWDFSAYSAAWQAMSWEERLELSFSKGLKAGGFALAVATIPRVAVCAGAQWVGSKMSAAFGSIASRFLTRRVAAGEFRLVFPTSRHTVQIFSQTTKNSYISNPLHGTRYTQKVFRQMQPNLKTGIHDFHGFPRMVDNYARLGRKELIRGRDGICREKISLEGSYLGYDGSFEWIIEANKSINHRIFVPNYKGGI